MIAAEMNNVAAVVGGLLFLGIMFIFFGLPWVAVAVLGYAEIKYGKKENEGSAKDRQDDEEAE